jgi:hypothetical protein
MLCTPAGVLQTSPLSSSSRWGSCYSCLARCLTLLNLLARFCTGVVAQPALSALPPLYPPSRPGRRSECVMPAGNPSLFSRALTSARVAAASASRTSQGGAPFAPRTCPATSPLAARMAGTAAGTVAAAAAPGAAAPAGSASIIIDEPPVHPSGADGSNGSGAAAAAGLHTLESLPFDNTFTSELPADSSESNVPRQVGGLAPLWPGRGQMRGLARWAWLYVCCLAVIVFFGGGAVGAG